MKRIFIALLLTIALASCSKAASDASGPAPAPPPDDSSSDPQIQGNAMFANQCPYGSQTDASPAPVELWDDRANPPAEGCAPVKASQIELAQPLPTLTFKVDCTKKDFTIRNKDLGLDHTWEILPGGHFDFDENGTTKSGDRPDPFQGVAVLVNDGLGHAQCSMPLDLNLSGDLDCKDRDKIDYAVDTVWIPAIPSDPRWKKIKNPCALPSACYFYARATIKQCS